MVLSPGFNSGLFPVPIFHAGVFGLTILVQLSGPYWPGPGLSKELYNPCVLEIICNKTLESVLIRIPVNF